MVQELTERSNVLVQEKKVVLCLFLYQYFKRNWLSSLLIVRTTLLLCITLLKSLGELT